MKNESISVVEAYELAQHGIPIVDVRTQREFQRHRAAGAINLPLHNLSKEALLKIAPDGKCLLICQAGTRSAMAQSRLKQAGLDHTINVTGGTQAWLHEHLPSESDGRVREVVGIDRQVRICAGALVVVGVTAAAVSQNPWWTLLSGFIGGGLVFAGVTNTCGMAALLAKMPWNK